MIVSVFILKHFRAFPIHFFGSTCARKLALTLNNPEFHSRSKSFMIRSGSSVPSLPNHFPDELVLEHIRDLAAPYLAAQNVNEAANDCNADMNIQQQLQSHHNTKVSTNLGYELTCGLVMKLKNAVDRLSRRSRIRIIENVISLQLLLLLLCKRFAIDPDSTLFKHWNDTSLYDAAHELICKSIAISADLQKLLIEQPFIQSSVTGTYIKFDKQFLQQVQLYFNEVSRPEGTFEEDSMLSDELITKLAELPRELCTECNGRRHVYCGDCCGKRLQSSSCILPSRVDLPFNILLVVHWYVLI